ncbi:MAG TPA: diguanylate cyclase [Paenibacillus sp.]|uniref:histidine kinase N-terminal 7TM domain-containing diguanylate cyclase n=1 Tax=Paenibacillus sp. TaxID=58172 RepID=UPI0028D879E9|nr:diguanylate cyclase [Paenibacillus sp.]HUC92818.1 diguanylate cyclase [Paenibacillus sp.]
MLVLLLYVFLNNTVTLLHKVYLLFHSLLMLWPLCQFAISTVSEPVYQLLFLKASYVGLAMLGLGWMVFTIFLAGKSYYLNRRTLILLSAPTLLMVLGILLNPGNSFVAPLNGGYVRRDYGPLFWVMVVVLLAYVALSFVLILNTLGGRVAPRHKRQMKMAMTGMSILMAFALGDVLVNIVLASILPIIPGLTSAGIVLSTFYFVVAIQRHRVFEIVRIAQSNVVDSMSTGVLVLDEHDVVLEANKVLRNLLDIRAGDRFTIEEFLAPLQTEGSMEPFVHAYRSDPPMPAQIEITLGEDNVFRHVVVHCEPIAERSRLVGRVLTFQDVSELRLLVEASRFQNAALQERNRALIAMQDELYQVNQKLEYMAITDGLTGCFNRRYLMQQLEHEVMTNVRYNIPFAIFLFDIDLFKSINDTYGHLVGDEVIKSTAEAVKQSLRRTDILARYGGEEFTVYLPHTNREQAFMLAERVKEIVSSNRVATGYDDETVAVTISMGVLTVESGEGARVDNPKIYLRDLFAKADIALYEAKNGGRNRIVAAEPIA